MQKFEVAFSYVVVVFLASAPIVLNQRCGKRPGKQRFLNDDNFGPISSCKLSTCLY